MSEKMRLMKKIQMHDFAVVEAAQFLDTHPNDQKALNYYRQNRDMKQKAVEAYQEKYGPLTLNGVWSDNRWTWAETPWPWESED